MKKKFFLPAIYVMTLLNIANAQKEKVIYEEHFNNNEKGWWVGETKQGSTKLEKGVYKVTSSAYKWDNANYWVKVPDFSLPQDNFSVECTIKWIDTYSARNNGYGIKINNYYFDISATGKYRLMSFNYDTGGFNIIVGWDDKPNSAINLYGTNAVKIKYHHGTADFYVNGVPMFSKSITLDGDLLGFDCFESEDVEFDDLVVKTIDN